MTPFIDQLIRIGENNPAAEAARTSIGPWTAIITNDLPALTPDLITEVMQSFGNEQNDRQHSRFFVPFLCAAQGLPHSQLHFVRNFIGVQNWNTLVERTTLVFQAAGITPQNTPWTRFGQDFYVNENVQLAMLRVESLMATNVLWNDMQSEVQVEELFDDTAGGRFMQLVGVQIGQAEIQVQHHHNNQQQQQQRQRNRSRQPPPQASFSNQRPASRRSVD